MIFSEGEQRKIKELPAILRYAIDVLCNAIYSIIDGECDADTVNDTLATLDSNAKGRYSDEDLLNYEEVAKVLGISTTNRMKVKNILDSNNIKQVVLHNQKVGFKRAEIMALRTKMYGE